MPADEPMLRVSVWRGSGTKGEFENFDVPVRENQTILDIVSWIQQYADPTLSYRFACRVGMCGSCAMMVNGEPRWTCRTHVNKVASHDNSLTLEPLRNLPVIKDLAADLAPFFEKWVEAEAFHHPESTREDEIAAVDPESAERAGIDAAIECINCAVCYAACDTVAGNVDYLGPAALQRAWTQFQDERAGSKDAILDAVSGSGGCHNCHSMGSCAHYCPNELNPLIAIADLKRITAWRRLKGGSNA